MDEPRAFVPLVCFVVRETGCSERLFPVLFA